MLLLDYHGVSLVSRAIRWRTWSDSSHTAIVITEHTRSLDAGEMPAFLRRAEMVEAWIHGGVQKRRGIHVGHTPGTEIDVYAIETPFADVDAVQLFLTLQLGKRYDYRGVLGFMSRRDGAQRHDRWFCSELVMAAVAHGGCRLLERVPPHRVSPGQLITSPLLRPLGTAIAGSPGAWSPAHSARGPESPQNARHPQGYTKTPVSASGESALCSRRSASWFRRDAGRNPQPHMQGAPS